MPSSSPIDASQRWAPAWVLLSVALWPLTGPAEAALSLGALLGLGLLLATRFRDGTRVLSHEAWALTTVLFLAYWLPELLSSVDAYDRPRALRESLLDLRYLPFLWLVAMAVANERGRRITFIGLGLIALAWLLDALVQATTGLSLGGAATADRLSGVFGADNLKLGLVLASLAPFPLALAQRQAGLAGWSLVALALVAVVLLAGARAAWLTLGLVLLASGWHHFGSRKALVLLLAGAIGVAAVAMFGSEQLRARIERTEAVLEGDSAGLDHALSGRLPIWSTALRMAAAHPVNGVGVRGFRVAYPEYAAADDPWLADPEHRAGYHAHQLVLEVLSETGGLGLLCWLAGAAVAWRAWRYASSIARARAFAPALALAATVFPLNTHLAFYSTFWGGATLLLAALYAGSLLAEGRGDVAAATAFDDAAARG